jgi:hypothetical protein
VRCSVDFGLRLAPAGMTIDGEIGRILGRQAGKPASDLN